MSQSAAVKIDPGAAFFEALLYDPAEVDLRLTDMGYGCVFIDRIQVREQGKGLGTRTMRMLTDLADRLGVQLMLVAAPLCDEWQQDALEAFYSSHGFVLTGRDPQLRTMIRT